MNTYYQGSDGRIHALGESDTLQHWKYIKKIGNRYFYTPEALQMYYRDQKKVATVEYTKDRARDSKNYAKRELANKRDYATGRNTREDYERNKSINKAIYDTQGKYRQVKRSVKPIAKTAKRAVTPAKTPMDRVRKGKKKADQILNSPASTDRRKKRQKANREAYRRYKADRNHQQMSKYQSRVRGA